MSRKTLLILTMLILEANPIMAAQKNGRVLHGYIVESCGKWTSYEEGQRNQYLLWLKGFFTGHNWGNQKNQIVDFPDDESLALYVDKYCRENPLGNLLTPTIQLTKELRSKTR